MNIANGRVIQACGTSGSVLVGGIAGAGAAATTSIAGELKDKMWMYRMRRNGNATPETMRHSLGIAPPFQHLVDPGTVTSQFTLVWENVVEADVAIGTCRVFAGLCQYVTAGDGTTLMGVGFYADDTDNKWHTFVRDSAAGTAPVTSQRDTTLTQLMTAIHRLKIVFDGATKTIYWYIDGTLVDSWTPAAALDRMTPAANVAGPEVMVGAFVPANKDVSVRAYAGALANIRTEWNSLPAVPPASGGTVMYVSSS
jgi:hypothetical protein